MIKTTEDIEVSQSLALVTLVDFDQLVLKRLRHLQLRIFKNANSLIESQIAVF